jgi:hypothetical protein
MISKPLSQIIEIPGPSLSDQLIPANDNHGLTALSRENLEAESILAPRSDIRPSNGSLLGPLLVVVAFLVLGSVLAAKLMY